MTLQLSTVAPLDAITRACNSVAGQAQSGVRGQSEREGREEGLLAVP